MKSNNVSILVPLTNVEFEKAREDFVGVYELYYNTENDICMKTVDLVNKKEFLPIKTYFQQVNQTTLKQMSEMERPAYQVAYDSDMVVLSIENANDVLVDIKDILNGNYHILNVEEVMYIYHWFGNMESYMKRKRDEIVYPKRPYALRESMKNRREMSTEQLEQMAQNIEFVNRLEGMKYCVGNDLIQDETELLEAMKQYEIPEKFVNDILWKKNQFGTSKIVK